METLEREASTVSGLIPNSWVDESGVRHAVIWDLGWSEYIRIKKQGEDWVLVELPPF